MSVKKWYPKKTELIMKREDTEKKLKQYAGTVAAIIIGAIAGLAYWHFIGCSSGTCPITSSPWSSTLWGAAIGGALFFPNKSK